MTSKTAIEAVDLVGVRLSDDGWFVRAYFADKEGQTVSLTLPTECLSMLASVVPNRLDPDTVHVLHAWSMDHTANGEDLVLTLRTPDARTVSFLTKPWQVKGMATIATWSEANPAVLKPVH
jgi:hypothetical protein